MVFPIAREVEKMYYIIPIFGVDSVIPIYARTEQPWTAFVAIPL